MTPEAAAQGQLDAYNARNLEAFMAFYADDVKLYRVPSTQPVIEGKAAFATFYGEQRFTLPELHAELVNRIVVGNKVIDHERVTGVREQPFEVAVAYEVVDGLIRSVWSFAAE
ncbi:MAG: nuclear transport factor 2 family protein [Burkholderiales bacterium]|nr:nuclear transport factor 2 family protein [Burkholderiales bacterium]